MITAQEALQRLKAGNQRFATEQTLASQTGFQRRTELLAGQDPIAVVLGCSDARAPAEMIFDQGLGDLFVIRVAGNIVAPSQVGSIEFAVEHFGIQLVVVLGHSHCGAVTATLKQLQNPSAYRSYNLYSIVDRIRPSVETLLETDLCERPDKLLHFAIRSNIRMAVNHLRRASHILEQLVNEGRLLVIGAFYSLESGEVEFMDNEGRTSQF